MKVENFGSSESLPLKSELRKCVATFSRIQLRQGAGKTPR